MKNLKKIILAVVLFICLDILNGKSVIAAEVAAEKEDVAIQLDAIGDQAVNAGEYLKLKLNAENVGENNYAYFTAEGLPTGINMDCYGMVYGSTYPEQVGSYEVTFTVTNGYTTDSETITLEIKGIELQAIGNQSVNAGDWVELQLNAENVGENNYAYYRAEGLPTGMTLYGDGMLHGST
ncbi:putative Ig domain-containing protein, partial [Anaeromicropila populeti]